MKKNGFISTSLIYTFFILFLLLMIFLMNSYSSTRFYIERYKYDIKNNFAEASMSDINLYIMVWDDTTQDYELQNEVPSFGYIYNSSDSYCKNGSTISFSNGSISVAATKRDSCYAFFDKVENDIDVNIYTKESADSDRVLVRKVPGYEYAFDSYSCTNDGAVVTFDEETRKLKITAKSKTVCDVIFVKREIDVIINIYKEDVYGNYEYDGLKYQKVNDIPGMGYSFYDAVCKGDTVITPVDGSSELTVSATGTDECDVYYNGGDSKVELIYMQETDDGVSGYTTGKKYSRTPKAPSDGYKYVGFKCDDTSAVVNYLGNGVFEAESSNQTICRAYFNKYSGDVYIHYYLETSDNTYESVSSIPSLGYIYNEEKSYCKNNSIIKINNNIVTVDATEEDECNVYYDMVNTDIVVNVYVMNRETQKYELGDVPISGYTLNNRGCTNGASIEYKNSRLVVNTEGPTVCTVYFR